MSRKLQLSRWLVGLGLLVFAEGTTAVAINLVSVTSAQAQLFGWGEPPARRGRPQRDGGFFGNLFGNFGPRPYYNNGAPQAEPHEQAVDNSRAPAPRKQDTKDQVAPTTSIVVMGDGMADWLAYGLEDAFSDSPEVAIVRKNKPHSGLLHYDPKGDLDWWHVARDTLAQEKVDYVVMMLGVSDRQNIREKDLAKETEKKAKEQQGASDKGASNAQQAKNAVQPTTASKGNGIIEFHSDEWDKIYSRRIDDTVAALKSKGVPVFWVGLPSIRGAKSTADVSYLDDLYRARVERAGAIYIDVWDGFVDEGGKFVTFGPDYEGQTRRLRSGDGVYFTKYGARKLAHYVEREIQRYMSNHVSVAFPSSSTAPLPRNSKPTERPLAGPVVPLTVTTENSDTLIGGASNASAHGDAIATQVLVRGEAMPASQGRADDFTWQSGRDANTQAPTSPEIKSPQASTEVPAASPATPEPKKAVAKAASKRKGASISSRRKPETKPQQ